MRTKVYLSEYVKTLDRPELEKEYVRLYIALEESGLVRDKDHVAVRRDGLWHITDCSYSFGHGACDRRCRRAREAMTFK